jgi:hypothetical protein
MDFDGHVADFWRFVSFFLIITATFVRSSSAYGKWLFLRQTMVAPSVWLANSGHLGRGRAMMARRRNGQFGHRQIKMKR